MAPKHLLKFSKLPTVLPTGKRTKNTQGEGGSEGEGREREEIGEERKGEERK
jgi:hypothetical protein